MAWSIIKLFSLIAVAIWATYFTSELVSGIFFITVLLAYFRSEDEAFWLVFFLALSDGFFGFFGMYQALLTIIPGLPAVEIGQLYILLSVVKAAGKKASYRPFYTLPLQILFVYLVFLIIQGRIVGLSPELNVQFRQIKWLIPLALFYSIPRLFTGMDQYRKLFAYLFPIAFVVLATQLFTILLGITPGEYMGVQKDVWFAVEITEERTYRGFYNDGILLITYLGALFFLTYKSKYFNSGYLLAVIAANYSSVFLSATRGWVISFTFILVIYFLFVVKFNLKRLPLILTVGLVFFLAARSIPVISVQINNVVERMFTLQALAAGDLTADGTLARLEQRSPKVMNKWKESRLTGWGFSDTFMASQDFHVGNQNILLHSGILGAFLLAMFFLFFLAKMSLRSIMLPANHPAKEALLVFVVFFLGYFIIHSSSQQLISYYQGPGPGIVQVVFFSFAALVYENVYNFKENNNILNSS